MLPDFPINVSFSKHVFRYFIKSDDVRIWFLNGTSKSLLSFPPTPSELQVKTNCKKLWNLTAWKCYDIRLVRWKHSRKHFSKWTWIINRHQHWDRLRQLQFQFRFWFSPSIIATKHEKLNKCRGCIVIITFLTRVRYFVQWFPQVKRKAISAVLMQQFEQF